MDRSNKLQFTCALIMVVLIQPLIGADGRIETPEQLILSFYENLLSDASTPELPEIFSEPTTFASALKLPNLEGVQKKSVATKAVWQYFRDNRKLFIFEGIDPSQTLKKARSHYVFTGFGNPATFFDGVFCVELTAPLSKGGK